ncbi:MAG: (d)CMP kinase [Bacteroidales bacterium]|nr:(d)CMP kinase [Bacteroidales bacterium]
MTKETMNAVPDIIIAIDGYSATGKSTLAKLIAAEFGFTYLDSGAMYRAVTLFAMESGLISGESINADALRQALEKDGLDINFGAENRTFIGDRCIEKEIRSMEVSSHVSPVAALAFVRAFVDEKLHAWGRRGRVVMDGRDIGTAVFPEAQLKLFVTASDQVRAQRRYDELISKGQQTPMQDVMANLKERDYIDSHRETNPLRQAEDAFVLDNSYMNLHEELVWVKGLIMGRFGIFESI